MRPLSALRAVRALTAASLVIFITATSYVPVFSRPAPAVSDSDKHQLSGADEAFLEDLSRRLFRYFWEQADPDTGLVLDRARADGSAHDERHRNIASIAATGFGLTAL